MLAQHPDTASPDSANHAILRLDKTRQDTKEGGLSISVNANDTNAVTLVDPKGHPIKHLLCRILQMHVLAAEQKTHASTP